VLSFGEIIGIVNRQELPDPVEEVLERNGLG
jgi:hypothetical protein